MRTQRLYPGAAKRRRKAMAKIETEKRRIERETEETERNSREERAKGDAHRRKIYNSDHWGGVREG